MKPLNRKNYGSIGHLPCSRMGSSDHHVHVGQQRICLEKTRDKHDVVFITEKMDGSNVGIARVGDQIYALGRAGYLAQTSKYEQHQLFASWVREHEQYWLRVLDPGERLVGEWLAQAHGTKYNISRPFYAFDLMIENKRVPFDTLLSICTEYDIPTPQLIHIGGPMSIEDAMEGHLKDHILDGGPEGVVYRVERNGEFDFMAKWVRPDKVDGKYLPEMSGGDPIWNWRP